MKKRLQAILQGLLGFDTYLFVFAIFKIRTLRWDSKQKEGDFNFFCRMLQPEEVVLDIGANVGIMTALMARRCYKGKVLAFEPVPENVKALRRVVRYLRLKNVTVFDFALGKQAGDIELKMPILKGVKMQGLSHVSHESIEGYEGPYERYQVKQQSLDQLPELKETRIAAIKMDVENYEQFILEGAVNLLQRDMPVLYIELWDNENRQRCFEILRNLNYRIQVLENSQLVTFNSSLHYHHNFYFIPPDKSF